MSESALAIIFAWSGILAALFYIVIDLSYKEWKEQRSKN